MLYNVYIISKSSYAGIRQMHVVGYAHHDVGHTDTHTSLDWWNREAKSPVRFFSQ